MSGNNTSNTEVLIRSELWKQELEEILHEMLTGVPFVRTEDFPDGQILTMPSIGTPVVRSRPEGAAAIYDSLDTGEVSIVLQEEVIAANKLSKKLRQDSMWFSQMSAALPGEQAQAIFERYETDVLALAMRQFAGVNNANTINGASHRFVGNGSNETFALSDASRVNYALKKAKIPVNGIIGIVDPSVAFSIENTTNLVSVSNNPRFEGIIETGITQNFKFIRNVFGIDMFESNLLPAANETIGGKTTSAGVANIFMSAANARLLPFVVAWKETPTMDSSVDFDTDDWKIKTTARWGTGLVRDENLVVVLTDTDQV